MCMSCSQCEAVGGTCMDCHKENREIVEKEFNQFKSKHKYNGSKRRCINCSIKFSHKNSKIKILSKMDVPICISCIDDERCRYDKHDEIPLNIMVNYIN